MEKNKYCLNLKNKNRNTLRTYPIYYELLNFPKYVPNIKLNVGKSLLLFFFSVRTFGTVFPDCFYSLSFVIGHFKTSLPYNFLLFEKVPVTNEVPIVPNSKYEIQSDYVCIKLDSTNEKESLINTKHPHKLLDSAVDSNERAG